MKAPVSRIRWAAAAFVAAALSLGEAAAQAPPPANGPPASSTPAAPPAPPAPPTPPITPSSTAPPSPPPSVPELLARGAAATAAGNDEACIEAYRAALALELDAATAGELGLCEEKLAHNVEAYDHLWFALEREVPAAPAPVRARWARFQQALVRLLPRVARVTLFVAPAHAEVLLDGKSLGTQMSGRTLVVLPGEHTWIARLPGRPDRVTTATARGGDVPHVHLLLDDPEPTHAPLPSPSHAPPRATATPACATCEPPRLPCAAADGIPMRVDTCNALRIRWRRMDPTLGLVAGGLLSLGFTADVGPGFFLGGEAHWRRQDDWGFQVGADVRVFLPTNAGTSPSGRRLDLMLLELALVPCARYKWVFGCAFVTPGLTLDSGPLTETPEYGGPAPLFVLGVGPRLGVDIPVTDRFGVRVFTDLRINPFESPAFLKVNEIYTVWEEPRVSGSMGLGISFR